MKKIFNKKFLVGFLFIIVFAVILISSNALKANAVTVTVTVSAGSNTLSYPNSGTTISWSSNADDCFFLGDKYSPNSSHGTGSLSVGSHTFTVNCTKADPILTCKTSLVSLSPSNTACGGGYSCPSGQVCLGGGGYCGGTYNNWNSPGGSCSGIPPNYCNSNGCSWVYTGGCYYCPGSICPSGYHVASCTGTSTLCVENTPCTG